MFLVINLSSGDVLEIEITVTIDKEVVSTLNNEMKLDDILVLHLINGKDFFVSFLNFILCFRLSKSPSSFTSVFRHKNIFAVHLTEAF